MEQFDGEFSDDINSTRDALSRAVDLRNALTKEPVASMAVEHLYGAFDNQFERFLHPYDSHGPERLEYGKGKLEAVLSRHDVSRLDSGREYSFRLTDLENGRIYILSASPRLARLTIRYLQPLKNSRSQMHRAWEDGYPTQDILYELSEAIYSLEPKVA